VQLKLGGMFARPRALSDADIVAIIGSYARAAETVVRAGFTGVQIHAAHGYLASQFLSPVVNRRDDRWGGPLEHRARFVLETVRAVRRAVGPGVPVSVKLNSADFQRGGFAVEDAARVAGWLAGEGIDLLEISGGTYERLRFFEEAADEATAPLGREAYFLDYAQTIRAELGTVPLMVTGGFRSRAAMTRTLAAGELDVVGLARPLCVEPELPRELIDGTVDHAPRPERTLRLGPGPLGPLSRWRTIRGLNHQATAAWFYRQILALADDRPLPTALSARRALLRHLRDEYRLSRQRGQIRHSHIRPVGRV
jgi:2,4-dienoyl-CoA reductase-like NADH-dependent reductase (Old Yellow Enzyme family)